LDLAVASGWQRPDPGRFEWQFNMAATDTTKLMEFLKANPPAKQFVPYSLLSKEADALTVYFEGDPDYSKRLNDHVTLFLSMETHEIVGCRIKGISGIISDLPNYLRIQHNGIELSIVFLSFRGGADEVTRNAINELGKVAASKNMKLETCLMS
jgi:hypothetical protein